LIHKKLTSLFLCAYGLLSYPLFSQKIQNFNLELNTNLGYLITNPNNARHTSQIPLSGQVYYWTDFTKLYLEDSTRTWLNQKAQAICNRAYNYPLIGLYTGYLGNLTKNFGRIVNLGTSTDIGFYQRKNHYLSIRPKLGLAYISMQFDSSANPTNGYISSPINLHFGLGIYQTFLSHKKTIKLGTELNHYSNAGLFQPNLGLNFISLNLAYQFGSQIYPWSKEERKELIKLSKALPEKNRFTIEIGGFSKQYEAKGKHYTGLQANLGYKKQINLYLDGLVNLFYSYDPSRVPEALKQTETIGHNHRLGIGLGAGIKFHRFRLMGTPGIYLIKADKKLDQLWFVNYQLNYNIKKHLHTFASLMTHKTNVDFGTIGLGIDL
jgi:hypothetical protein